MKMNPIEKVYIWRCLECENEFMLVSPLPFPDCCPFCGGKSLTEEDEFGVGAKDLTKES